MRGILSLVVVAAALALAGQACSGSKVAGTVPPDGGGDGGGGGQCRTAYQPCSAPTDCCSGPCTGGFCQNAFCKAAGSSCAAPGECCSQVCSGAPPTCGSTACKSAGSACASGGECCSTVCSGTPLTCQVTPGAGTCKTLGEACALGSECCSTNCRTGICVAASSCQAYGDICHAHADCCGGICDLAGVTVGRCTRTTGATSCGQDGVPCAQNNDCCTQVCTDLGAGVPACAVASGCRVTGDYCGSDQQCCGGGSNPNGSVQCATSSRCDNGQNCNGVGTVCGKAFGPLPDGGYGIVFQTAANNNCCDGKDTCHLDSAGIPRCFGGCSNSGCTGPSDCPFGYTGQPGCCIPPYVPAPGECGPAEPCPSQCQFGDQCCGGNPCLPLDPADPSSIYVCTAPTCRALGSTCTVGGTACCEGSCLPAEPPTYLCQLPLPPPDGGPTCRPNGATCVGNADCCSALCIGGTCQAPQVCQPQGGVCTATADCCTGLTCTIPAGQASGTCEPGSTCPSAGQQCSPTQACCPGLLCTDQGTFTNCTGTTVCICVNPG